MKYECPCGYVYDPLRVIPTASLGTAWEDVPEDWVCPSAVWERTLLRNLGIFKNPLCKGFC